MPRKSSRKIPGKNLPKFIRQNFPTHFCRSTGGLAALCPKSLSKALQIRIAGPLGRNWGAPKADPAIMDPTPHSRPSHCSVAKLCKRRQVPMYVQVLWEQQITANLRPPTLTSELTQTRTNLCKHFLKNYFKVFIGIENAIQFQKRKNYFQGFYYFVMILCRSTMENAPSPQDLVDPRFVISPGKGWGSECSGISKPVAWGTRGLHPGFP